MKRLLLGGGLWSALLLSLSAGAAPAGTPDFTFGTGFAYQAVGYNLGASWDDTAQALVQGPAGRLYVAGSVALDNNQSGIGIVRLLHNGLIDENYGTNGKAFHKEPGHQRIRITDAALQADGKLVVVGYRTVLQPYSIQMTACRFLPTGDIDTSFGSPVTAGCRAVPSPVGVEAQAESVAIQADGRIVLFGHAFDGEKSIDRAAILRLEPNGDVDKSLANTATGVRIVFPEDLFDSTRLLDGAISPDGAFFAAGDRDGGADGIDLDGLVVRVNASDGSLDDAFDGAGYRPIIIDKGGSKNDTATSLKVAADGSVVIAGTATISAKKIVAFVARMDAAGGNFPGFGSNGIRVHDTCLDECSTWVRDLQVTPEGALVIVGSRSPTSAVAKADLFAMRLLANGEPDTTYGTNLGIEAGMAYFDIAGSEDQAYQAVLQGSRVTLGGSSKMGGDFDFLVARLDHGIEDGFTVTPVALAGGQVNPSTPQDVAHSDQVDFLVQPSAGHFLEKVDGDCGGAVMDGVFTTAPITADCQLTFVFSSNPVLTYLAQPGGVIVGPTPQSVPFGGAGQAVTATAETGFHFAQWDDGSVMATRQDSNVQASKSFTAQFDPNLYEVSPNPDAHGVTNPLDTQFVPHGKTTNFVILPDPGYGIGEISGCPGSLQGNVFVTAPILEGCKLDIEFVVSNTFYTLRYLASNGGTVTGNTLQSVLSGDSGTPVEATPNPGFMFLMWKDGLPSSVRQDTHVVADLEVAALFVQIQVKVSPSAGPGGSITPDAPVLIPYGTSAAFTIQPLAGFSIGSVGGTCTGTLAGNIFTTSALETDCSVVANFKAASGVVFKDSFEN